jgi:hypothetical protein
MRQLTLEPLQVLRRRTAVRSSDPPAARLRLLHFKMSLRKFFGYSPMAPMRGRIMANSPVWISVLKDLLQAFQSLITAAALVVGGLWAYHRYVREDARHAHIQTSADINFIGKQGDQWIVELIACLKNKGKVQHLVSEFFFDFDALFSGETAMRSEEWGGQVNFPHDIARGSFLPAEMSYFFIGPGVEAKYSYITSVPADASIVMLHCRFKYTDRAAIHTMERTLRVPKDEAELLDKPAEVVS